MKKFTLLAMLCAMLLLCHAQSNISPGVAATGTLAVDLKHSPAVASAYYSTKLPAFGTVQVSLAGANIGPINHDDGLTVTIYDKRANQIGSLGISAAPGGSSSSATSIYARSDDSVYFTVTASNDSYTYSLEYTVADRPPYDHEPNNTVLQALSINAGDTLKGNVLYTNNGIVDSNDYYKTKLPAYGTVKVYLAALNTALGTNYSGATVYVYDKAGVLLGNTTTSPAPGKSAGDSLLLYARSDDSFFFRVSGGNSAYSYALHYVVTTTPPYDKEPNNTKAQALNINEGNTVSGNVLYIDNGVVDSNDYYKTKLPSYGTVKVYLNATNTALGTNYSGATVYVYDKNGTQLSGTSAAPAPGKSALDSLTLYARSDDSLFFKVTGGNSTYSYSLRYTVTNVPPDDKEPNDSIWQATAFNEGETMSGNILYTDNGVEDVQDYYKTKLPGTGTIKVYLAGTNTGVGTNYQSVTIGVYKPGNISLGSTSVSASPGKTGEDSITLNPNGADSLYFLITAGNSSYSYSFHYQQQSTLPLTLLNFMVANQKGTALILWQTAQEINMDYYNIERSTNGSQFTPVGKVMAATKRQAINNYTFTDTYPPTIGTQPLFYRLQMVNNDGTFTYSGVKQLTFNGGSIVSVYPNPTINRVTVEVGAATTLPVTYRITDVTGKLVQAGPLTANRQTITLNTITKGLYFLQLGNGQIVKIEKQ